MSFCSCLPVTDTITNSEFPLNFDIDLRSLCPDVFTQGNISCCTSNAAAMAYKMISQNRSFEPSRLFLYNKSRIFFQENSINHNTSYPGTVTYQQLNATVYDTGANGCDVIATLLLYGVCSESLYPYDYDQYDDNTYDNGKSPLLRSDNSQVLSDATKHKIGLNNGQLPDTTLLNDKTKRLNYIITQYSLPKQASAVLEVLKKGYPVLWGFKMFSNFTNDTSSSGIYTSLSNAVVGFHCCLIVGYCTVQQLFLVKNCWGSGWGKGGYFVISPTILEHPTASLELYFFSHLL